MSIAHLVAGNLQPSWGFGRDGISARPRLTTNLTNISRNNSVETNPSRVIFRDNAEDCAFLAERAGDIEVKRALKRMEEAWRTLAQEQEQLDNKRWSTKKPP